MEDRANNVDPLPIEAPLPFTAFEMRRTAFWAYVRNENWFGMWVVATTTLQLRSSKVYSMQIAVLQTPEVQQYWSQPSLIIQL